VRNSAYFDISWLTGFKLLIIIACSMDDLLSLDSDECVAVISVLTTGELDWTRFEVNLYPGNNKQRSGVYLM
jgi:hypothetical protein